MGATNHTPYLNLPQFVGSDVPAWLVEWNNSMQLIDNGTKNINTVANTANNNASSAIQQITNINGSITDINDDIAQLQATLNRLNSSLVWQYNPWTRLEGAGPGTYVSTFASPYLVIARCALNAQMNNLNPIPWYGSPTTYFYPFAQLAKNLWNAQPSTTPSSTSTVYLGHVTTTSSNEALGAPNGTTYGAIWTWWNGQVTNIGILRNLGTISTWEIGTFTVMGKPINAATTTEEREGGFPSYAMPYML